MHKEGDPDRPSFSFKWGKDKQLSVSLSKRLRHSMALDLLYLGSSLLWIGLAIAAIAGWSPKPDEKRDYVLVSSAPSDGVPTLRIELDARRFTAPPISEVAASGVAAPNVQKSTEH